MSADKKKIRKQFREVCLTRDNYQCRVCSNKPSTELLDVHHITDRKEMPNGGYVKENGITLCPGCHQKAEVFHASGKEKFEEGYHPDDLYVLISSGYEQAINADK